MHLFSRSWLVAWAFSLCFLTDAGSAATDWPRSFTADGTAFTVYQPQLTNWSGNILTARVALSVLPAGAAQPQFGTVVLSGTTSVDNTSQSVSLSNFQVLQSSFPSAPEQAPAYAAQLAGQASQWAQQLSLPALKANLAVTTAESGGARPVAVQNPVPAIIFSESSAVLILVDGNPALRPVSDGSTLLRAINTRALLLLDQSSGNYFLRVNGSWTQAPALNGPWVVASNPPASLDPVLQQAASAGNVELFDPPSAGNPMPSIFVSTVPAELITTQGPPQFAPVPNTRLLHVSNSGSSVFLYLPTQAYYVVISGRWFTASSLTASWQYVPATQLPPDFSQIPETSPAGTVLTSVAGTPQAQEAAISSTIPQTATISRTTTITVSYDGDPQFEKIGDTGLSYALNTSTPVIQISAKKYYAVLNGVWFTSASAQGPWTVADSVPPVIYTIPPACPIYYVTNVFVYGSTPDAVSVGYTPGYFGSCLSPDGVVVFGTGYSYPPYIGTTVWYGPPLTYGFGAGFACGLATGFAFGLAADHGWGCSPWWGPWHGGWENVNVNVNRNGNWNNVNVNSTNVYNRWSGNEVSVNNTVNRNQTLNNWKYQTPLKNDPRTPARATLQSDPARLGNNNVFAGDDGHVYRSRNDGSWQRNDGTGWSDARPSDSGDSSSAYLDRQRASRAVGAYRTGSGRR